MHVGMHGISLIGRVSCFRLDVRAQKPVTVSCWSELEAFYQKWQILLDNLLACQSSCKKDKNHSSYEEKTYLES